ncbi:MAG TPA: prohibitin family protein [Polyangia bacterium]|nr:prohibitin family protein [Polyangia bacterium]
MGRQGFAALALLAASGCGAIIEPGHRGLLFDPRRGGLQHEVLGPGYQRVGLSGRIDDFDVTYSTRASSLSGVSQEGMPVEAGLAVTWRPVIAELYQLDTELGAGYADEVVVPEFRSAARAVLARHSFLEAAANEKLEDEIEATLRQRLAGKHVEVASVTLQSIRWPPGVAAAVKDKLLAEQEARGEYEASRRKLELDAARAKLQIEQTAASRRAVTVECRADGACQCQCR